MVMHRPGSPSWSSVPERVASAWRRVNRTLVNLGDIPSPRFLRRPVAVGPRQDRCDLQLFCGSVGVWANYRLALKSNILYTSG